MTPTGRQRQRDLRLGLTALVGLFVLVVGVPLLLVRLSSRLVDSPNPLTGATAPWTWTGRDITDVLTRALDQQTVLTTISRVGLVIAWLALAVVAVSVVLEVRSLHRYGHSRLRRRGLGWSQAVARRLASGLLALSSVLPAHLATAAPLGVRTTTPALISASPSTSTASPQHTRVPVGDNAAGWVPYRVVRGDSIYRIAGRLADNEPARTRHIAQQILDRNLNRTMNDGQRFTTPGLIQIGWTLDIPTDTTPIEPDNGTPTEATYTVRPGDNYWTIATHDLEHANGRQPTADAILTETNHLIDTNRDRLGERTPHTMLYPGDVLILPTATNDTTADTAAPPVSPAAATVPQPSTVAPPPLPATAPPGITTTPETEPPTTVEALPHPDSTSSATAALDEGHEHEQTPNPWTRLAIASLFATGMAATVTRLRRRRLARRQPGHRLTTATPAAATTETVLRAEARPDRIGALHHLLAGLAGHTRLDGERPLVRAVQLADTGIEMLWTEPQPRPPKPWTTTDGGWSWHTPWPDQPVAFGLPRPVLPTLVPIGVRDDGAEVLLDLETVGALALDGPTELVEAFARQLVLTLAATPLADNVDVITVDIDIPAAVHLDRMRTANLATARGWVSARTRETRTALTNTRVPTTFAARLLARANDEWEPVITLAVTTGDDVAALVEACAPGSGSVAIVTDTARAGERIVIHDDRHAECPGLGITFTPFLVTPDAAADLAELLDHTENADEQPVLDDRPHQPTPAPDQAGDDDEQQEARPPLRCYDVLVRVLGEIEIEGCAEHLTEAETELLALLATVRPDGPINIDRLATLLAHDEWRTPKPRSIQARISHLRRKLGNGSDDTPLVPDSRAATGTPNRYLISPRVITDIDLLDRNYRHAGNLPSSEAIAVLRASLELIRGKPYTAAAGYSWAYDEHAATRAVQVVGDIATRLIDLYGQAGDTTGIRWTIRQADRAIDDPLAQAPYRHHECKWLKHDLDPQTQHDLHAHTDRVARYLETDDPTEDDHDITSFRGTRD